MCTRSPRMSRICVGCGRSFSFRGYNAHHSRPDAPPQCKGRNHERIANVSVNARNYRVSLQGGVDDDLPEDDDEDEEEKPKPKKKKADEAKPAAGGDQKECK